MKKFLATLLLLSASIVGFAQNARTVTGRVTEPDGTPVISAMVIQKGTTNGAATDLDGNFSIRLSGDVVLEISSIGYETANVSVPSTQNVVDVILKQDAELLEDAVVIGYGVQNRRDVTTSIVSIKSDDLQNKTNSGLPRSMMSQPM